MTDWQSIVDHHGGSVWRTAYRLLGDREEAADRWQETFLAVLELSRRQRIRNWRAALTRICTCRAVDQLRRRLRNRSRHTELPDMASVVSPNPGPVAQAQAAELSERLRLALVSLPAQQAEVFCLRCMSEMSYRDIARQLGIKTSAVGVLLHRARLRLRNLLSVPAGADSTEVRS